VLFRSLAAPPLYRITKGAKTVYAQDEEQKNKILASAEYATGKVDVGRFKGLGEMMPSQLKETTMDPSKRTLARVSIDPMRAVDVAELVETLMGKKAELRFRYIQEHARFVEDVDL